MSCNARSLFFASCTSLVFVQGCFQDFDIQPNDPSLGGTGTGGDGVSDTLSSGDSRGSAGTASDDGGEATSLDGGSQSDSGIASSGGDADAGDDADPSSDGDGGDASGTGTGSASAGDDSADDSGNDACPSGDELVFDGSFETAEHTADNSSLYWEETVPEGDYIVCDASCVVDEDYAAASDGNWWAWFGGTGVLGVWRLEQDVTLPAGASWLDFNLLIPNPDTDLLEDSLQVRIDGQSVFTVTASTAGYQNWTAVHVDIGDFADGQTHTLAFVAQLSAEFELSEFLVDEVSIICD